MPEQHDRERPHGDPLKHEVVEENRAQRESDAPDDAVAQESVREDARKDSDSSGLRSSDDSEGERRRKLYDGGAELVSKID